MANGERKGTLTPLNSIFTPDEAEKAARMVEEAVIDRRNELCRLRDYISENSALIHLVQKLPEELTHDIMVPFGGAAFFPGRLIHTNEFLVLLGEGYHAERSAKQTVEILQRRGKYLEAQVESLKRVMKDLEAEAKFFDSTAAEVAEGLVEIREEYVEEFDSKKPETGRTSLDSSKIHNFGVADEEDEHAKIMARLDELEREEEEAGSYVGKDEDDEIASSSDCEDEDVEDASNLNIDEDVDDDADEEEEDDGEDFEYVNENTELVHKINDVVPASKDTGPETLCPTSMQYSAEVLRQHPSNQSSIPGSTLQVARGGSLKSNDLQATFKKSNVRLDQMTKNPSLLPVTKEYLHKSTPSNIQNYSESSQSQSSVRGSSNSKAFTGSVIEHSQDLHPVQPTSNSTSAQVELSFMTSRPISRFKLQKGNR